MAFEADLPAVEPTCNVLTGAGCTLIPITDTGGPAQFYPFFTTTPVRGTCTWQFGNDTPGETANFGRSDQYGSLLPLPYLRFGGGGSTRILFTHFGGIIDNPC